MSGWILIRNIHGLLFVEFQAKKKLFGNWSNNPVQKPLSTIKFPEETILRILPPTFLLEITKKFVVDINVYNLIFMLAQIKKCRLKV